MSKQLKAYQSPSSETYSYLGPPWLCAPHSLDIRDQEKPGPCCLPQGVGGTHTLASRADHQKASLVAHSFGGPGGFSDSLPQCALGSLGLPHHPSDMVCIHSPAILGAVHTARLHEFVDIQGGSPTTSQPWPTLPTPSWGLSRSALTVPLTAGTQQGFQGGLSLAAYILRP